MPVAKSANIDVVMDFHGPDKVLALAYTAAIKSATGYSARRLEAPTVLGTTLGANGRQLSYTAPVVGCELGCGYRPRNCGAEHRQQGHEQWRKAVSRSAVAFSVAR